MVAVPVPRLFTVDEYHRLGALGFFAPDERVELIEGEIFVMPPIGDRHATCVDNATETLVLVGNRRFRVRVQGPVALSPSSEPQPDLIVYRRRPPGATGHPKPEDVWLIIEVSDSTLAYDLGKKQELYARGGIRELWVIDIEREQIHVFRSPEGGVYREHTIHGRGETITLIAFPAVTVAVDDILP